MTDKIKYCKCGHRLHPNHDNPKMFLKWKYNKNTNCNSCYCDYFINRVRPRIEKYVVFTLTGLTLFCAGVFFYFGFMLLQLANEKQDYLKSQMANFTQYDLCIVGTGFFLIAGLWIFNYGTNPISNWFSMDRRKEMPIDDRDPHE